MHILTEIAGGSAVLLACALVHINLLSRIAAGYQRAVARLGSAHRRRFRTTAALFVLIALSHVAQICVWALAFRLSGALSGVEEAIYFALTTYTTLGYGDVVLSPQFRIFGAMAGMTGILCFGLSTALLVGHFTRLLTPDTD